MIDTPLSVVPAPALRLLLTRREAARALGISERMLWELTNAGELMAIRLPGRGAQARAIRYAVDDLRAWIDRIKSANASPSARAGRIDDVAVV